MIDPTMLMSLLGGMGGQGSKGMGLANLAGGLLGGLTGLFQKRKANKMLDNLQYPTYETPKEVMENKQIATKLAGEGLPSEQYAKAMKDIQRQQVAAMRSAQDRRGGLGLIGAIQQGTNDATLGLNAADAQARINNQRTLMNVNSQVGQYRDKEFQWNKANKYQMDRDYAMSVLGAGNQNLLGGLDKGLAGAGMLYDKGLFSGLFGARRSEAGGAAAGGVSGTPSSRMRPYIY
jgi:hypothetical protein